MTDLEVHHDGYPRHRRKARFDWSDTPLHWVPGDPFSTHLLNVIHLLLPECERWFIQAINEAEPLVSDLELKTAIKPFIQQESWHAWAHQMVLLYLTEQGIDTTPYTDKLRDRLSKLAKHHPGWPRVLQRWWLYRRLAVAAALEPFNTAFGQWLIQNRGLDDAGADQTMLDLLRWHGAEEVEHRSLVFDVYQNVCGNYALRVLTMLSTAPTFAFWWIAGMRFLMAQDPTIRTEPHLRDWLRAARQYRVPGPWLVIVTVPGRYIQPGHHPSTEASTQLALDYLEQSPAARAARELAEAQLRAAEAVATAESSAAAAPLESP
jgi:predicted metal-dependent hydrolase